MITKLTESDIPAVVRIHKAELSGFLSELGEGFLSMYYKQSLYIPEVFTILEKENGIILGICTGTLSSEKLHFKIIKKDIFGFIFELLKYFITHPAGIVKIIKTAGYPGLNKNIPELLTIAVEKRFQKKGIGKKLFMEIAQKMREKGVRKFLISIYARLPANGFYKAVGCKFYKSFDFLGEKMNYYEYRI